MAGSSFSSADSRLGLQVTLNPSGDSAAAHSASNVALDPVLELRVQRDGSVKRIRFSTDDMRVREYYWTQRPGAMSGCAL